MMPVLATRRIIDTNASPQMILAACIVRDGAEALAEETVDFTESARYMLAADRLTTVLESTQVDRHRLLKSSPALINRSGRKQTLIEMIEADPGDDAYRLRLAKLMFRALPWCPETFPAASY